MNELPEQFARTIDKFLKKIGAGGGDRTRTALSGHRILSWFKPILGTHRMSSPPLGQCYNTRLLLCDYFWS